VALFRVNAYNHPGKLIDGKEATYLISKEIPSPMGGFLSAFTSKDIAEQALKKYEGELFSWQELQQRFKINSNEYDRQ